MYEWSQPLGMWHCSDNNFKMQRGGFSINSTHAELSVNYILVQKFIVISDNIECLTYHYF